MADYEQLSREELLQQVRELETAHHLDALSDLRDSEERLHAILRTAVEGIITIDERGIVETMNPAAEKIFGWRATEVVGRNVSCLMPNPYSREHDSYLQNYVRGGHAKIIGIGREVTGRRKDGTTFPVHLSVGEMVNEGRRSFTGILHDLSDRVALENRLAEQKSLAKLGEMAAVVAHEVKNPIAGIRGALQVITSRMPAEQRDRGVLIDIIARLDALNRIVQDMLMFARPRALRREPVSLAALLGDTVALIERDPTMSHVQIALSGAADISGDREMLQVVFQNILMNAAQAMENKGRIEVSIGTVNGRCSVAIADQGPGMPEDVRARAFDAFFTTKHRGTGLGLPIARRVIEAHGGTIQIDAPPSGGTMVTIVLPLPR